MQKKIILALSFTFIFSACDSRKPINQPTPTATQEDLAAFSMTIDNNPEEYLFYYESQQYRMSLYEPENGCYLGAYILSNRKMNFDIKNFETAVGKKHAVYTYYMTLYDKFPVDWVLSCIANMKTPNIVITPPSNGGMYERTAIDKLARDFGEFYIPMFVHIYPLKGDSFSNQVEYIQFFRYAATAFRKKASNVSLVWTTDKTAEQSMKYYPGDEYADWVGFSFFNPLSDGGYADDIFNKLEPLYFMFDSKKPMMISELAVSHYSTADHAYRISEASGELTRIYDTLINDYPRIKMVSYMDFNAMDISNPNAECDNFMITDNGKVLQAYKDAISDERFMSNTEIATMGDITPQLMKSADSAYKYEDKYFLSEECVRNNLSVQGLTGWQQVSGRNCIDIEELKKSGIWNIEIDDESKKIVFYSK